MEWNKTWLASITWTSVAFVIFQKSRNTLAKVSQYSRSFIVKFENPTEATFETLYFQLVLGSIDTMKYQHNEVSISINTSGTVIDKYLYFPFILFLTGMFVLQIMWRNCRTTLTTFSFNLEKFLNSVKKQL